MKKVVSKYGRPRTMHAMAWCQCGIEFDLFSDEKGRSKMYQHIRETGHTVHAEYGSFNEYSLETF